MTLGRWAAVVAALAVCLLTFGGALGVGPSFAVHPHAALSGKPVDRVVLVPPGQEGGSPATPDTSRDTTGHQHKQQASDDTAADKVAAGKQQSQPGQGKQRTAHLVPALPADSGSGKRVVFDISDQRVWLVAPGDHVKRTYLVSGSIYDNLHPGTYSVYSKSRHAIAYNYKETMKYMVRFTHGQNAAIGFHAIPVDHSGHKVQTRAELGTPRSDGCIRQALPDAKALWRFAPVGTKVVVLA